MVFHGDVRCNGLWRLKIRTVVRPQSPSASGDSRVCKFADPTGFRHPAAVAAFPLFRYPQRYPDSKKASSDELAFIT